MDEKNISRITMVYIIGFQIPPRLTSLVLVLFILMNWMAICGNLLIIVLVFYSRPLHSPMYFFISQLSVSDILLVTDILPTLYPVILKDRLTMPFSNCFIQLYFFAYAECLECLLLTVMSYDRYVAICRPLHYALIMNRPFCMTMIASCYFSGFPAILTYSLTIEGLMFCGPNYIDHYFCDLNPVLELSCSDTTYFYLEVTVLGIIFAVAPFFIIVVSYVYIIMTILKIPSIVGRQKVFSTCSSHLTTISIYYVTLLCVYLVPSRNNSRRIRKLLSLLYTEVTPLLNPIIYSLRNKDLKKAARKFFNNIINLLY